MSPLTHLLSLLASFKLTRQSTHSHIFDLPPELLLAILKSLPDYHTLYTLLLTHPIFNSLTQAHPHATIPSIAETLFGKSQLPCISTFLQVSHTGTYTPTTPPPLTTSSIPHLLTLHQALQHARGHYIAHTDQPPALDLIDRSFIRIYSVAMVLLHHPVNNNRPRQRSQRDSRTLLNREMFVEFFETVPRAELGVFRTCLERVTFEESGLFMVMPPEVHARYVRACVRNVKDLVMWDYDFGEGEVVV